MKLISLVYCPCTLADRPGVGLRLGIILAEGEPFLANYVGSVVVPLDTEYNGVCVHCATSYALTKEDGRWVLHQKRGDVTYGTIMMGR